MNGFRIVFSAATLAALVSAFGVNAARVITTLCAAAFASVAIIWPSLSLAAFSPAASMLEARVGHTATLLPSGQVLVAGGGIASSNVELYNPGSNTWSVAAAMANNRSSHTATLLHSGVVVVTGGLSTGPSLSSAEIYDPSRNAWSPAAAMATARESHTATLLPSGKVLVAGGVRRGAPDTYLARAELYDPARGTWSAAGFMATGRAMHTATLLPSGQVLVAGGLNLVISGGAAIFTDLASAELYDPASNTWSAAAPMASVRYLHTATLLPSGRVLVAGGALREPVYTDLASAELYDPASNTWSAAGTMATAHESHTATLLLSGKVLVVGDDGFGGGIGNAPSTTLAELYDPASNTWTYAGSLMDPGVSSHTATRLPSGKVLVAGGVNPVGHMGGTDRAELYDPQLQTAVEYYYADWDYYFVTSFPAEIGALDGGAFGGLWQRTGKTFNVWPVATGVASPTCRFFSTAFAPKSSHFYTPFPIECAAVKANPSWQYESIAFYIQIPTGYGTGNGFCPQGTVALYRAYNNGMGGAPNHRYMTNLGTLGLMLAQGWTFEGEANTKVFACVPQ